jgi:gentisate 1,2-dioxygenase
VQHIITVHVHVRHVLRLKPVLQQLHQGQVAMLHRHVQWRTLLLVVGRGVRATVQQQQQCVRTPAASTHSHPYGVVSALAPWPVSWASQL